MTRTFLKTTLLGLACAAVVACSDSKPAATDTTQNDTSTAPQKTGKTYRVISEQVKPPLITYVDGKPTGFEYDVLQAIAKKQGINLDYQTVNSREELLTSLSQHKADLALGAITINDDRKQQVDFSNPILDYSGTILVRKPLANATSWADLKGKKIASRHGTVYDKMALDNLSAPDGKNIVYYNTVWEQVKSLINNQSEVVLGDSLILDYYVQQNGSNEVAFVHGITFPKESYGFAIKKGDTELQQQINDGLAAIRTDGTYAKIYQNYWTTRPEN